MLNASKIAEVKKFKQNLVNKIFITKI
jgi:hypothetical protein